MNKLLVVDDEEEIQDFLREFFANRGYSVVTAGNKEEACKVLLEEKPLVVLLDIRMRGARDGLEILEWIKGENLKVKIIMVTGIENQEVIQEAMRKGADDYITKPLSLEYLETRVAQKIAAFMNDSHSESR